MAEILPPSNGYNGITYRAHQNQGEIATNEWHLRTLPLDCFYRSFIRSHFASEKPATVRSSLNDYNLWNDSKPIPLG